jgi:hypothetical protein
MRRKSHLLRDHFVDKFGREGQVERDSLHGACFYMYFLIFTKAHVILIWGWE